MQKLSYLALDPVHHIEVAHLVLGCGPHPGHPVPVAHHCAPGQGNCGGDGSSSEGGGHCSGGSIGFGRNVDGSN